MRLNDRIKLMHGDCLELMKEIPDGSVDLVLTDLPYQVTSCSWDNIIPFDCMWKEVSRIVKDKTPIIFTAIQPFTSKLVMSKLDWFKCEWIWDKHIPRGFQNAKYRPMNKHESVLVFCKTSPNYYPIMVEREKPVTVRNYSKRKDSVVQSNTMKNDKSYTYTHKNPDSIIIGKWEANAGKVHPTQKPVSLMEYLIETYSLENDLVLDFTAGSFTTGVACVNTNRKFIGIEKSEKYFKIGVDRVKEAIHKLDNEDNCVFDDIFL